jgi:hypothetical protein
MHKLVILILPTGDRGFDDLWPEFLHAAERIPGLRREATSRVGRVLYGNQHFELMHELFFDSYADLEAGLNSDQGVRAGQILHQITNGRVLLFLADHTEDNLERIRSYRGGEEHGEQPKTQA